MTRAFELLGFRPVAVVRKRRTEYHLEYEGRPMIVALDLAEGLGAFAEVETLVEAESDLPEGQAAVLALAGELGLVEVEPRSYLRMVLEAAGASGSESGWPDLSESVKTSAHIDPHPSTGVALATEESPDSADFANSREARAMDRRSRRYVPSSEGLEGRQLLSTTAAHPAAAVTANPFANASQRDPGRRLVAAQQTIEAKRHRIENLPLLHRPAQQGRLRPPADDPEHPERPRYHRRPAPPGELVARLDVQPRPPQGPELREHHARSAAASLNRDFGAVLVSAGAPASTVANLQEQLTQLVNYDSTQVGSTIAATND